MDKNGLRLRMLGDDSMTYVREQLMNAGHLSSLLANRPISSVVVWLPERVRELKANDFYHGGIGYWRYIWVDELNDAAISSGESIVIADGWSDEPWFPHLKAKQHFLTEAGEVYYFSSREHRIDGESLVRWVSRRPGILCISSLQGGIEPNQTLTIGELERMATNTRVVYIGAYDEETFLKVSLAV